MFKAQREAHARKLETLEEWELHKLEDLFRVTRPDSDELELTRDELRRRHGADE